MEEIETEDDGQCLEEEEEEGYTESLVSPTSLLKRIESIEIGGTKAVSPNNDYSVHTV